MKSFIAVALNESSMRVRQLHEALKTLGYPVAAEEVQSHTAGKDTLRQVRTFQAKHNIQFDDKYVVDKPTYDAIKAEMKKSGHLEKAKKFVVQGTVYNRRAEVQRRQKLIALDVDLRGAAIYRSIKNLEETRVNGGFEFLGETFSGVNGHYYIEFFDFQFAVAERKKADVIIYAVNENNEVLGSSRLVNSEDYSSEGEVQRLDVIIRNDERTEYAILMDKLLPFLGESKVSLLEIYNSNDQVAFAAGELDANEVHIRIAADAEALRAAGQQQTEGLLHELLYGIGRQDIALNWLALFSKTEDELKAAIARSVQQNIIKEYDEQTIAAFLRLLHGLAVTHALTFRPQKEGTSLQEVLAVALPEQKQQTAFIDAYRSFKSQVSADETIEYKKFWKEYLPGVDVFKDNPKLIKGLLFSQQLNVISGGHLPLIREVQVERKLSSVTDLISLEDKDWKKIIEKTGVPAFVTGETTEDKIAAYAGHVQTFLSAGFPTQKIAVMMQKKELPVTDEKVSAIIQTFLKQDSGFDISVSPVHEYAEEIKTVAGERYTEVKQELNRMQRVFQVSPQPEVMSKLMQKELNSAYTIANIPRKSFIELHGQDLGGEPIADAVYQRAEHISTLAAERAIKMYDLSHLAAPALAFSKDDRDAAIAVLQEQVSKRHNPNYSEIFGSPDICECSHCRSVYSAAAYYVDLLRFIWRGLPNADGNSPLDMLKERRPDLLYIPLTCENTNTLVPYIDLVNEIMEYYTYHGTLDKNAAYDTGETTADELRANPQNFEPEAYRILKNTVYPFSLPYHQPLDLIRIYSDHLQIERHEIMKGMQKDFSVLATTAIGSEALRISEEEFRVLTLKNFAGDPDLDDLNPMLPTPVRQLQQYYGFPFSTAPNPALDPVVIANMEKVAGNGIPDGIHEFLRRTGIKYTDLVELIKTKFINPYQHILKFLESLFSKSTLNAPTIYSKLQQINAGTLDPATDAAIMALIIGKISPADFKTWVQQHFGHFNEVITLYQSNSKCDLNTTYLKTVKNVYDASTASGITFLTWSKVHRFIRLWRKLGFTIHETDLMLEALGENDITDGTIAKLSSVALLNKKIKLPVNKLAALWGSIDMYSERSLYIKLFLNKAVQRLDQAFQPDEFGNYLTDPTKLLKDHIPALLSAFRMSEDDLYAIAAVVRVTDNGVDRAFDITTEKLTIYNVSIIYRYTILSKALKLKVPDFCLLTRLFSLNPFSTLSIPAPAIPPVDPVFIDILPDITIRFYELAVAIKKTGFRALDLQYIFAGQLPAESSIGLNPDKTKQTIRDIRDAFTAIEQSYPAIPAVPLTTDILSGNLSLSFKAEAVSQLIGIIGNTGSPVYTVITDANLAVVIPDPLSAKFTYIKASGRLSGTGVMTGTEQTALKALPGVTAGFQAAVDAIFKMPEDFIRNNFSGVFAAANAILPNADLITLLNRPAQPTEKTVEEKVWFVYSNYLPLLKQKLHEDVMVERIASLTGLSNEATAVLIKDDLPAFIAAITTEGFSGDYFSNAVYGTPASLTRTDKAINFNWGVTAPDPILPANNFSIRWQSYLSPTSSGEYTLIVDVKGADDSFNLYIDEALILAKPAADPRLSWEVMTRLNASQLHELKLEYADITGNAGISISWKTATTAVEIIPSFASFPANLVNSFIATVQTWHRAGKFITGFKLTDTEVRHFVNYPADFSNINFKALTPDHWQRIENYFELRNGVPQGQALLTDVFAAANIIDPPPALAALSNLLNLATAWDLTTLSYLTGYYSLTAADFKNEVSLLKIYTAISYVLKTGLSPQTLAQWAAPETDFNTLNATAGLVKSTVKAKYEEEDWHELAGSLSDKVRENQKQALINYLLTKQELIQWGVTDADGLFEYFLIDVQMGACMDTSRIVQATAAAQMFVNRCLLNLESNKTGAGLEKGVSPGSIDKDRWEWMKNYRVWEANRKVFLYPENWLEPEWRDDRSPFFKELESELTQNDITDANVETAFRNYLNKLNVVANPNVCGMYQENYPNGSMRLLHVFGRTHNSPYQFFYRTCNEFYKWSAWEKLQVDIRMTEDNDNSGVQLMPVVWKNRLFIFWIEFIKKQDDNVAKNKSNQDASFEEISSMAPSSVKAKEYYEIRLAWSEYVDKKWSSKQITKEFIRAAAYKIADFTLQQNIQSDNQLVMWVFNNNTSYGGFTLTDIQAEVLSWSMLQDVTTNYQLKPKDYANFFMEHKRNGKLSFRGFDYLKNNSYHKILFSTKVFDFASTLQYPFFFRDSLRSYFVRPININIWDYVRDPSIFGPVLVDMIDPEYYVPPYHKPVGPDDYMPQVDIDYAVNNLKGAIQFEPAVGVHQLKGITQNAVNGKVVQVQTRTNGREVRPMAAATVMSGSMTTANATMKTKVSAEVNNAFAKNIIEAGIKTYIKHEKGLQFHTFYHPFSSQFVTNLNNFGIAGLMNSDTFLNAIQQPFFHDYGAIFTNNYNPNFNHGLVTKAALSPSYVAGAPYTYYKENICFDLFGANSIYNWELFFHAPLYIATRLSKNGQYEEAMKWFHYIFDPTTDELPLPGQSETSRYWKVFPFKTTPAQTLEDWFASIGLGPNNNPLAENAIVAEWRNNPFMPFIVARNRPIAFMKNVVIKYVENLREWGDSLFRMFTRESVNEALQLYVMAGHILGPRPQFVPKRGEIKAETYDSLKNKWDDFSNAFVELENIFPYSSAVPAGDGSSSPNILGIGPALYFCIPSNDKLMEHWDTIADRLYKIRHCMDIDGVERQLALFAPPIDPAMLINAAAQGISLGSILSDLSSAPPIYRFTYLIQKANDFCGEVKSLGNALIGVLEKKDGETLAKLRASHETMMLDLMTGIKERQVLDARSTRDGLLKSRAMAEYRLTHYNALISTEAVTVPAVPAINVNLTIDSQLPPDTTIPEIKSGLDDSLTDEGGVKIIDKEKEDLDLSEAAKWVTSGAGIAEAAAAGLRLIPQGEVDGKPLGVGAGFGFGGVQLGGIASGLASAAHAVSSFMSMQAAAAQKISGYVRREQEWTLQANLAAKEIASLDKQITSAEIKIQIAEKDLFNHKQQIENSKQVEDFLKNKFSNEDLYQWMKEQLFAVYKQSFNMAYDMAKKVEKCYRYEIGNEITNFIQYGYWDNSRKGLCAGEKLQLALQQLETAYHEENKRELELNKSISMALLNPLALQELRTTGKCFLAIPEELYDMDYQGHYFRRIKSVSLSLPCIAGPYTTINCTLRLLKNIVRTNTSMNESGTYEHNNDEGVWTDDDRFKTSNVPVKAIATSTGQRDAGMFELNFRDERYLPFEGAGAISEWKIELTQDAALRQFDYSTISDVILHINYTAREDAGLFREKAVTYLKDFLSNAAELSAQPLIRMFSFKHEFSTAWNKFLYPVIAGADQTLSVTLQKEHFPFFTINRQINVSKMEVLIKASRTGDYKMVLAATDVDDDPMISDEVTMPENATFANMQKGTLTASTPGLNAEEINILSALTFKFKHSSDSNFHSINTNPDEINDLFFVIHYKLGDKL